jgi:hypothetical protein
VRGELNVGAFVLYKLSLPQMALAKWVQPPVGSRMVSLDLQGFTYKPDAMWTERFCELHAKEVCQVSAGRFDQMNTLG